MQQFDSNGNLPQGIHHITWEELVNFLGFNDRRRELLAGLNRACVSLSQAGCATIYIGGSFVTSKQFPGDFDVCWDDEGVDFSRLKEIDPVLLDFSNKRANQKAKYGGELFPANAQADLNGRTFLEFFQLDRDGNAKGIISINLLE